MTRPHPQPDRLTAIDLPVPGSTRTRPAAAGHAWSRGVLLLPRVSVIVSCYNYAKYIAAALDSVAGQSYRDFECVVVDDASTDNSVEVIPVPPQYISRNCNS
jgi:cellulose synthase/poly-beta-1,6-N-acetylglucosamine synthase-like glycosyltransferase